MKLLNCCLEWSIHSLSFFLPRSVTLGHTRKRSMDLSVFLVSLQRVSVSLLSFRCANSAPGYHAASFFYASYCEVCSSCLEAFSAVEESIGWYLIFKKSVILQNNHEAGNLGNEIRERSDNDDRSVQFADVRDSISENLLFEATRRWSEVETVT